MGNNMMQGDQYLIPIEASGFDIDNVELVSFYIGGIIKEYPDSVTFDAEHSRFLFPITQAETLPMRDKVSCQARVKFTGGDIIGVKMGYLDVFETLDRAVL